MADSDRWNNGRDQAITRQAIHPTRGRRRLRHWRRWLLATLALLALTLVACGFWLTRPARLASLAASMLAAQTGSPVQVGQARLHWNGLFVLEQVDIGVLNPAGQRLDLFHVAKVEVTPDWRGLLAGRLQASDITFTQPRLDLIEDLDHQRYNVQLFQDQRSHRPRTTRWPDTLPQVAIRQGILRFGEIRDGQYVTLARMGVSGQLAAVPDQPGVYTYELLHQPVSPPPPPEVTPEVPPEVPPEVTPEFSSEDSLAHDGSAQPGIPAGEASGENSEVTSGGSGGTSGGGGGGGRTRIGGQVDLRTLAVTARVDGLVVEEAYRQMLPRAMRDWWDRLDPGGALPDVRIAYDPTDGVQAALELQGVSLTLPFAQSPTPMTGVTGRFMLTGQTVQVSQLRGWVHDVAYEINGRIDGLNADAPFDLTAQVADFHIPADPDFLPALPPVVQKQFQRFAPSGTFSATVNLRRAAQDGPIHYDGQAQVRQAQGIYAKFPYPLTQVQGQLRFNEDTLEIVSLQGQGLGGGHVTITGRISPPRDDAAVDIRVSARDIPIDERLYHALDPDEKEVYDGFLDAPNQQRLREAGLIQSADQKQAADEQVRQLQARLALMPADDPARATVTASLETWRSRQAIPVFEMGGLIDVDVHMTREYGPDKPYLPTIEIDASRVNVLSEPWGYPLRVTAGLLRIEPGLATLKDIRIQGLDGLSGQVRGQVTLPRKSQPDSRFSPDITFEGTGLPITPLLLASLPDEQAKWVERLAIVGKLDLVGRAYREGVKPLDFDIHAKLAGGHARPFEGQMILRDVAGQVVIHRHSVEVQSLVGSAGQAVMAVQGDIAWSQRNASLHLKIQGKDVGFYQPVLDLVPEQTQQVVMLRTLIDAHQPEGVYDMDLTVDMKPGRPATYAASVQPRTLSLDHQGKRVTFDTMQGSVTLTPARVTLDDLAVTHGPQSQWRFGGQVDLEPALTARLRLQGSSPELDDTTMALLPPAVRRMLDSLSLKAAYRLEDGQLDWRPGQPQPVTFAGKLHLSDTSADLGVPVSEGQGRVTVEVQAQAGDQPARWSAAMQDFHVRVMDRQVESLQAVIQTAEPTSRVVIPQITGRVYQGRLTGDGEVLLEEPTRYALRLTLQDAAAQAVIDPTKWTVALAQSIADGQPHAAMSGNLALQGTAGEPASLQGRGRLEIRNANLYQTPVAMALLQVISLTWPAAQAFDRAQAIYVLQGQNVHFDTLRLETPSLGLVGQGTMTLPDGRLDLQLVLRNLTGPEFGPLGDLFRVLRDGLIAIHVNGTLGKPVAQVKPLSGIRQSWNEVFGTSPKQDAPQPARP